MYSTKGPYKSRHRVLHSGCRGIDFYGKEELIDGDLNPGDCGSDLSNSMDPGGEQNPKRNRGIQHAFRGQPLADPIGLCLRFINQGQVKEAAAGTHPLNWQRFCACVTRSVARSSMTQATSGFCFFILLLCCTVLYSRRNICKSSKDERRALRERKIVEEKQALVDDNDRLKHEIQEKIKLIDEKDRIIISNMMFFKAESKRLKHEIEANEHQMKFNLGAIEAEERRLKREIEEKKQLMKSSLEAFEKGRLKSELKENEQLMKSSLEEFEFEIQSLMYEIVEKEQLMKSHLEAFEAENGRLKREIEEKEQLMESNMETFEATIRQLNNEVESLKGNSVLVNQRLHFQSAKLAELRNEYAENKKRGSRKSSTRELQATAILLLNGSRPYNIMQGRWG